jgi:hypothetical protein
VEPGIGFEPTNLLITNQLLYQLSYPGEVPILPEIQKKIVSKPTPFRNPQKHAVRMPVLVSKLPRRSCTSLLEGL